MDPRRTRARALRGGLLAFGMCAWPQPLGAVFPFRDDVEPGVALDARRLPPSRTAPKRPSFEDTCHALHERLAAKALADAVRSEREADALAAAATEAWQRVNAARARFSMPALRRSPLLGVAARLHARDMAERGYRDHTSPEGCTLFQRVVSFLEYPSGGVAENLASGTANARGAANVAKVVDAWLESPGHRMNMLHPEYVETGVAVVRGREGELHWVQVFGDGDTRAPFERGRLGCPEGFVSLALPSPRSPQGAVASPPDDASSVCSSATHVLGPFPRALVGACKAWRAQTLGMPLEQAWGPDACEAPLWPRATFFAVNGQGPCPPPARLDGVTGYCVDGPLALGPFPSSLRAACRSVALGRTGRATSPRNAAGPELCEGSAWPPDLLRAAWTTLGSLR